MVKEPSINENPCGVRNEGESDHSNSKVCPMGGHISLVNSSGYLRNKLVFVK